MSFCYYSIFKSGIRKSFSSTFILFWEITSSSKSTRGKFRFLKSLLLAWSQKSILANVWKTVQKVLHSSKYNKCLIMSDALVSVAPTKSTLITYMIFSLLPSSPHHELLTTYIEKIVSVSGLKATWLRMSNQEYTA